MTIKVFVITVVALCAAYAFFIVGPEAESKYFPVVDKLQILSVKAGPKLDTAIVSARFRKIRGCDYLGIAWYRILPNESVERVAVVLQRDDKDTSSPNRPIGVSVAGPWVVSMPAQSVEGHSIVEVFHRCHPFWTTRTPFYP